MSQPHSRYPSSRSPNSPDAGREAGIPWITWVIGGAALIVAVTAAAVFLEKREPQTTEAPAVSRENPTLEDDEPVELIPKSPLDLSRKLLDAQERAKIWSDRAMLASIEAAVTEGKELALLTIEFGQGPSSSLGEALGSERFSVTYAEDIAPNGQPIVSAKERRAVPEPNCPLEAAVRSLERTGAELIGSSIALYLQSTKHERPIWLLTTSDGTAHSIDADTCRFLTR